MANFIKQAVVEAYKASTSKVLFKERVHSHQIRLLFASIAHASHVTTEDIMSACSWSSETIFTRFYLRSLVTYSDTLFSLGPLKVAQTMVAPASYDLHGS